MNGLQRLAIVGVAACVVAGGVTVLFVTDWGRRQIERIWPADRETELGRRALRPEDPDRKTPGLSFDAILNRRNPDGTLPRPKPAEPMPPTSCRSVEPAPKHADNLAGPHRVHLLTVMMFEGASGFG